MSQRFSGKCDIYLEVAERYERFIRLGVLRGGDKLPSVRQVAEELRVNPNTVHRAYSHLEARGLIYSLPKKGVFVTECEAEKGEADACRESLRQAIIAARDGGVDEKTVASLIKEIYGND